MKYIRNYNMGRSSAPDINKIERSVTIFTCVAFALLVVAGMYSYARAIDLMMIAESI